MPKEISKSESSPEISRDHKTEKEILWEEKRKSVEQRLDKTGKEMDKGIIEIVMALNMLGLPTSGSCEGHIYGNSRVPWVDIEALDRPKERFPGEREIYKRIAEKYGITYKDIFKSKYMEIESEAFREACQNDEMPAYQEWRAKTEELRIKIDGLLREFYQQREAALNVHLEIREYGEGGFRIHNGGEDYRLDSKTVLKMSKEEKEALKERLKLYQKEMQDFTEFLRNKFFEKDQN